MKKKKLFAALLAVTLLGAAACGNHTGNIPWDEETPSPTEVPKEDGLKAYYELKTVENGKIKDLSGNGYDGTVFNYTGEKKTEKNGAVFLSDGAYIELPAEIFKGEDTLTVSLWLKSYSGSANTSAMFVGTTESLPISYWLLNPANPAGKLKSVLTDGESQYAPFNTEIGISPSDATKGIQGPVTDMKWNHYVTVITETELTVYLNGELVGTVAHTKKISEFGADLVAYIGRSSYLADPTYAGFCRELKVYTKALTAEEIKVEYERTTFETAKQTAVETDIFIADRADPCIHKGSDGYYYFTASYPMYGGADKEGYDRVILRRSETIEGLKDAEEIVIWDEKDDPKSFRYIWAPEIHEINGKWYVLFTASNEENNVWGIKCHVLACMGDDPYTDPWINKGIVQTMQGDTFSFRWFALDMTYFECNGKHYVAWAQTDGNSNVYLATINPEQPWKLTSFPLLLTKPEYFWEKVSIPVNEGPAVMVENGKVYLAFSASATGPEYCIGLMYADETADLMDKDSWTKLPEPLLTSEDLIGEYGPGHNSFVKDENGDWLFVYHSRDEKCYTKKCGYGGNDPLYDPCRSARVRKVQWDEDGIPILNR
ncbi:MAG: hypothetical protein E7260_05275 [Lachnospiraceae bacterium]|nr:hypothetical protein [Lachnospiraceae bacterium]